MASFTFIDSYPIDSGWSSPSYSTPTLGLTNNQTMNSNLAVKYQGDKPGYTWNGANYVPRDKPSPTQSLSASSSSEKNALESYWANKMAQKAELELKNGKQERIKFIPAAGGGGYGQTPQQTADSAWASQEIKDLLTGGLPQSNPAKNAKQYGEELIGAVTGQFGALKKASDLENQLLPGLQRNWSNKMQTQYDSILGLQQNNLGSSSEFQKQYSDSLLGLQGGLMSGAVNAQYRAMDAGGRSLYDTMNRKAQEGLNAGTGLTQQEIEFAQQSARAAAEARGVQMGRQGSDLEILNTYSLGQQRLKERQAQAQIAYGNSQKLNELGAQAIYSPNFTASQDAGLYSQLRMTNQASQSLAPSLLTPESQYYSGIRGNDMQSLYSQLALKTQLAAMLYNPSAKSGF